MKNEVYYALLLAHTTDSSTDEEKHIISFSIENTDNFWNPIIISKPYMH